MSRVKASGRSKYGAKRTSCGQGHKHDSKKEAKVCDDLSLMEKGGVIHELQIHPSFALYAYGSDGSKVKVCSYEADFQYIDLDKEIVLDVKGGVRTRMYSLKKKLMKICHGIDVQEA